MMNLETLTVWVTQNRLVAILLIIAVAYLASWAGRVCIPPLIRLAVRYRRPTDVDADDLKKRQDTLSGLLRTLLQVAIWITALLIALNEVGINFTALLASAGVIGLAIGFGAQSLIKDFLSGLFIIFENQYRVGDTVELGDATGVVERMTARSTVLRDFDGNVHFVPNGSIIQVVNKTLGFSKINLTINVSANTNIDRITEIINKVGNDMAKDEHWKASITQAPHFSNISNFTENSLAIDITGTTLPSRQWNATNELRKRLIVAFKTHKIELAP